MDNVKAAYNIFNNYYFVTKSKTSRVTAKKA